jgi:hypothetical protein
MADYDGFCKTWKVDWVAPGYPETCTHQIKIDKLASGRFRVSCLDASNDHPYEDADCVNGELIGDDGSKIHLTTGSPNRITFIPPSKAIQPGSWTANDSGLLRNG